MRIIQSSWACNETNFLTIPAGWVAPEYKMMSWALSCLQLRKYYDDVTLYADGISARTLIDTLQLPYTHVVCNLDELNSYHPHLWALPKLAAYAQQEKPFLHVDSDVFIWKAFPEELLESPLIAQNEEEETNYYRDMFEPMDSTFSYFPPEILAERYEGNPVHAYNAGILGGNQIGFFKQYTQKAFDFIHHNSSAFSKIDVGNFNIFYEQYLFYCIAKKENINVSVLIEGVMGDNRYEGFGDFMEVPYKKTFLHLLGVYKKNTRCCEYMANRLRKDYPDYYYRIFQLFRDHGLPFRNDSFSFVKEKTEKDLLKRYYGLKENAISVNQNGELVQKPFSYWRSNLIREYFREKTVEGFDEPTIQETEVAAIDFEEKLIPVVAEKFLHINKDELYRRDIISSGYVEEIFSNESVLNNTRFIRCNNYEIVQTNFDWAFLELSGTQLKTGFELLLESRQEGNHMAIVPECYSYGYSITNLDELDMLIRDELAQPRTIPELLQSLANAFEPEELEDACEAFQALIYGRIKMGLWCKIIEPVAM